MRILKSTMRLSAGGVSDSLITFGFTRRAASWGESVKQASTFVSYEQNSSARNCSIEVESPIKAYCTLWRSNKFLELCLKSWKPFCFSAKGSEYESHRSHFRRFIRAQPHHSLQQEGSCEN